MVKQQCLFGTLLYLIFNRYFSFRHKICSLLGRQVFIISLVYLEGSISFISVVGIVNIKGNISTIHSYNRRKVKEEDIPKYGKTVGTGTLIIGISLVLGFIVSFQSEIIIDYIILPAVIVGLGFILYGQFKYNKGIF